MSGHSAIAAFAIVAGVMAVIELIVTRFRALLGYGLLVLAAAVWLLAR